MNEAIPICVAVSLMRLVVGEEGTFTKWTPWNSCSESCGWGHTQRTRSCTVTPTSCWGALIQTRPCRTGTCPAPQIGVFTIWSDWDPCSVTCGEGTTKRTRLCEYNNCLGELEQTTPCELKACPTYILGLWTKWTHCEVTCGKGFKYRRRTCDGTFDIIDCDFAEKRKCEYKPCPGLLTEWSAWSGCSTTCGGGKRTSCRQCVPSGSRCQGFKHRHTKCNKQICPAKEKHRAVEEDEDDDDENELPLRYQKRQIENITRTVLPPMTFNTSSNDKANNVTNAVHQMSSFVSIYRSEYMDYLSVVAAVIGGILFTSVLYGVGVCMCQWKRRKKRVTDRTYRDSYHVDREHAHRERRRSQSEARRTHRYSGAHLLKDSLGRLSEPILTTKKHFRRTSSKSGISPNRVGTAEGKTIAPSQAVPASLIQFLEEHKKPSVDQIQHELPSHHRSTFNNDRIYYSRVK